MKKKKEKRESFLEIFLEFVNFKFPEDLESHVFVTRQSEFVALLHTYTAFLCQFGSRYPFLSVSGKHDQYARDLLEKGIPELYLERMGFFGKLQEHLRSKLEIVTRSFSGGDPLLVERPGKRKVLYRF